MKTCDRCGLSKDEREFRRKTSGDRAGFIFPTCMPCEQEVRDENAATDLRARGYTITKQALVGGGAR